MNGGHHFWIKIRFFLRIKKEIEKNSVIFFINILAFLGIFLIIVLVVVSLFLKKLI